MIGAVAYAKGQIEAGEERETNWNELEARAGDFSALATGFKNLFAEPEPVEVEEDSAPQVTAHGLVD